MLDVITTFYFQKSTLQISMDFLDFYCNVEEETIGIHVANELAFPPNGSISRSH